MRRIYIVAPVILAVVAAGGWYGYSYWSKKHKENAAIVKTVSEIKSEALTADVDTGFPQIKDDGPIALSHMEFKQGGEGQFPTVSGTMTNTDSKKHTFLLRAYLIERNGGPTHVLEQKVTDLGPGEAKSFTITSGTALPLIEQGDLRAESVE